MYIRDARRAGGGVAIWGVACGGGDGCNPVRTNHRQCGGIGSIAAISAKVSITAIAAIAAIYIVSIAIFFLLLWGGVHIGANKLNTVVFAARADAHPRRIHTRKRIVKGGQQPFHSVFIRISITALAV